jgi:hypothetical protein
MLNLQEDWRCPTKAGTNPASHQKGSIGKTWGKGSIYILKQDINEKGPGRRNFGPVKAASTYGGYSNQGMLPDQQYGTI